MMMTKPTKTRTRGRQEGSIYQRADGLWVGAVTVGTNRDGSQRRKTVSSTDLKECRRRFRELEARVAEGYYGGTGTTFKERADDWLAEMKHQVKARTLWLYRHELAHAHRKLGEIGLKELTAQQVRAMQRELAAEIGPATAKKVRDRVASVLEAAYRDEEVPRNVAKHVKAVRVPKHPVLIWSSEEIDLFLETAKEHRLYALFYLYLATGARRSEALALKWDALDFKRFEVHIHETLTMPTSTPEYGPPKTAAGWRTVPAEPELFEVLAAHRERQQAEKRAAGQNWEEHNLVFPADSGKLLRSLDKSWERLKAHAAQAGEKRDPPLKLTDVRVHDLRHTFVSMCIAAGMDAPRIAEVIGHSDPSFTYKTYAHVFKRYETFRVPSLAKLKGEVILLPDPNEDAAA